VIGRVREIEVMRNHDDTPFESPLNHQGPSTSRRPGAAAAAAAALPAASRTPAAFYQAPRRDFFHETATRPDYNRPGLPRYAADYGGRGGHSGHRQYVSKFTVAPRY